MKKEQNKQANFRLPEALLVELREVSEETDITQTAIVCEGVQEKVNRLKNRLQRKREREAATV